MSNVKPFRGFTDQEGQVSFIEDLRGRLKPILDFEKSHRKSFIVEIRKNYIDLYFLGHAISVKRSIKGDYYLTSADKFRPKNIKKWPVSFKCIKNFKQFMSSVMTEIVLLKKGNISEGISEINHYVNNRALDRGGILVIDRQVAYKGCRVDLLGLKDSGNGRLHFVVIELKNKENKEIETVFSGQVNKYMKIIMDNYDEFKATYDLILKQKVKLGLIDRRNKGAIIAKDSPDIKIEGIAILDNYNIRSKFLKRALLDWRNIDNRQNTKLYLKTNVLNNPFLMNYEEASKIKV